MTHLVTRSASLVTTVVSLGQARHTRKIAFGVEGARRDKAINGKKVTLLDDQTRWSMEMLYPINSHVLDKYSNDVFDSEVSIHKNDIPHKSTSELITLSHAHPQQFMGLL